MFVFKAAVVGAGTMGGEIAQVIAAAGVPVILKDIDQRFVDQGLARAQEVTRAQLGHLRDRGKLTPQAADAQSIEILGRITPALSYDGFGDVDFVIEAVPERLGVKQAVLGELDLVTPGHAILASNTSSLSITELGLATSRPDLVLGFHFFYPASMMRLIEVIGGELTSAASMQVAVNFAQTLRKVPIRSAETPGFVVNRVLNSAVSEIWRVQEDLGLSIGAIDRAVAASRVAPMGPFFLGDLLGLDTVHHVAMHLRDSYGERFYVHRGMAELVAAGELGAKTGRGFYENGEARTTGSDELDGLDLEGRFVLKALVESCLLLEEGAATVRDIDLGMMAGAGLNPPPFARADQAGLDTVLASLEQAAADWGEQYEPPGIIRRLVAQGRLGSKAGQGFLPYPQVAPDQDGPVKLERRGEVAILWLDRPPANSISPDTVDALRRTWDSITGSEVRAVVIASANSNLFCAGADIKSFTQIDAAGGRRLVDEMHGLLREWETSRVVTIAAVNGPALGGGCEVAMGCDLRIAAESASFAQPEINLGIIPGFGGTQRLGRLVGPAKALEMNLTGQAISAEEAYDFGLVNRVVPDHELLDAALAWARMLGAQAPLAIEAIKRVSDNGDLDAGIEAEKAAFADVFGSADAREGIGAFLGRRRPKFTGS
ncbi:MAG: enoyl-CoA hydratase / 3-hydroxyacyl-CoA dehydrogenase [Solirubrobacteraceae bacterium]|jgi:enoyl-CoA hydratase/3-hydroxyacyl-CoA dehydrogenase|nr:enoyl-CoA hydratase / 3-hydroxyacyl-CoA dehydrogenase [Solirubrobacteraceae bacterium]